MTAKEILWLEDGDLQYRPADHPEPTDPYEILGVDRRASDEELRRAYRRKVARYHPDRWGEFAIPWATRQTQAVNTAFAAIQSERE